MNPQKLNLARIGNAEQIEANKIAIVEYLRKHGRSRFNDIARDNGIKESNLTNRLLTLRKADLVEYMGRTKDGTQSSSWYGAVQSIVDRPESSIMIGYPETYLVWGGWKSTSDSTHGATA